MDQTVSIRLVRDCGCVDDVDFCCLKLWGLLGVCHVYRRLNHTYVSPVTGPFIGLERVAWVCHNCR